MRYGNLPNSTLAWNHFPRILFYFFLPAFSNLPATNILPSQPPPTPYHLLVWAWARSQTRLKWKAVMKASSLAEATVSVQDFETPPCKLKSSQNPHGQNLCQKKMVLGKVWSQMVAPRKRSSRCVHWARWMKRVGDKWKLNYRLKIFSNSN